MRLFTAISWFFKILAKGDAAFAEAPSAAPAPAAAPAEQKPTFTYSKEPAIQLLGLLQKEGRLVDFLMEDVSNFSDAEIGGAVRDIHRGCRKVLQTQMNLKRIAPVADGGSTEIPAGYDPSHYSLRGNVSGSGPFRGTVVHGGWIASELKLPTVPPGGDPNVVYASEVEVK